MTAVAKKESIKITYIGGGSQQWAIHLMSDLALCSELEGELILHDIDNEAALMNVEKGNRLFARDDAKTKFVCRAEPDLYKSLEGADFVVLSIEPGPIECRYADLVIPEQYGILQPVGDTCGPGGMLRALRAVPTYFDFAHAIMTQCPKAWVINYTNPMTLCTAAMYEAEPDIKAFGCCHEVFGTQERLAGLVEEWFKVDKPQRHDIKLDITGVNHFTWATRAHWNGINLFDQLQKHVSQDGFFDDLTDFAKENVKEGKWFNSKGRIAFDLFRNFGALGAAGDRHLAEFVPWYLNSEEILHSMGVARTPYEWRLSRANERKQAKASDADDKPITPSGEEGVMQMKALVGLGDFTTNCNIPNYAQMPQQETGAVVESYAQFSKDEVRPLITGDAPAPVASLIDRVVTIQQTTIEAIADADNEAIFAALLTDPLMGGLKPSIAAEMWGKMLENVKDHIPGWAVSR